MHSLSQIILLLGLSFSLQALGEGLDDQAPKAVTDLPAAKEREADRAVSGERAGLLAASQRGAHRPPAPTGRPAAAQSEAARLLAQAALLAAAQTPAPQVSAQKPVLSPEGRPGQVRLVCMTTGVIKREKNIIPPLPLPPFSSWRRWLREHENTAKHCALDWMDARGQWWHTELRGYRHHEDQYRVGEGEFIASGVTIYGVFILPGRTDPEDQAVIFDEPVDCDYRVIEREARAYGRKDKRSGDPGTGGKGEENVGLGGPAFKPTQCSNTYISYLLRRAGVRREAPAGAIGWDTIPRFPYSTDADGVSP